MKGREKKTCIYSSLEGKGGGGEGRVERNENKDSKRNESVIMTQIPGFVFLFYPVISKPVSPNPSMFPVASR